MCGGGVNLLTGEKLAQVLVLLNLSSHLSDNSLELSLSLGLLLFDHLLGNGPYILNGPHISHLGSLDVMGNARRESLL